MPGVPLSPNVRDGAQQYLFVIWEKGRFPCTSEEGDPAKVASATSPEHFLQLWARSASNDSAPPWLWAMFAVGCLPRAGSATAGWSIRLQLIVPTLSSSPLGVCGQCRHTRWHVKTGRFPENIYNFEKRIDALAMIRSRKTVEGAGEQVV